jgi:hypothetical protein
MAKFVSVRRAPRAQVLARLGVFLLFTLPGGPSVFGQSLGAGTIKGNVTDVTGAALPAIALELSNAITGYSRQVKSAADGLFVIPDIPQNSYVLRATQPGFQTWTRLIAVRSTVPVDVKIEMAIAGQQTTITVEDQPAGLVENVPVPSHSVDQSTIAALPTLSPGSGLNDAITFTTPNVAADSNGFFHPLGDHAQVSYVVDGQPISDQRNKVFSTSIPANAIQSMEIISGSPSAEYGDKTSLVINASTRSGLGQKPSGSLLVDYGSFGTIGEDATLGLGGSRWGNFVAFNTERSGRFLDTPEFWPMHAVGNTGTFFDRVDFLPSGKDSLHFDLLAARNWLQTPNTYDQPRQDQRQKVLSYNIAPGYQHTVDAKTLITVNAFFRRDQVDYYPSRNAFDDSPATLAQNRSLTNYGLHADLSRVQGRHNLKVGLNAQQTKLSEAFSLGVTDPSYNSPCQDQDGNPVPLSSLKSTSQCTATGFAANPGFLPSLLPYDLTRDGSLYTFQGKATISQVAWFGQDTITFGNLTLNIGLRYDYYNGLTRGSGAQPRGAFSYLFKSTKTVIRGGYTHSLETPVNENLVVSSSTGSGGLASNLFQGTAEQRPIALGSRNQYDAGIQQSFGRWILIDVSYFRKYTRNAYDFNALFSTPITFPIGWAQSKLDGVGARISTPDIHGLRVYATMGHANARFFGPENGGIIFNSDLSIGAYRQDHDQIYQQNVNIHYQPSKNGWWGDFTWRYDSGLVVGAINNLADALALTAAQQSAIGLYCGDQQASLSYRITSCNSTNYGAQRINILAPGAENNDHNPPRTKPRNIFDLGVGNDNLFHKEHVRTVVRFTILNLSNEASLYNFLSPFSGTHWFQPRSFQAQIGWAF